MTSLQPIEGFRSLETHHCVTGSMRHVYQFHGHPISEEMLLGLGAGVGFVYWHMKGTLPFLGGRANTGRPGEEGLERTAGRRTGVKIECSRTNSAKKAEKALTDMLAAGEPAMLQVDMGFLPYFDFPVEYHFGGHMVVAAGYDPGNRHVLIADRDAELHPVSLERLALARGSQFQPFPPQHGWYSFDFTDKQPPRPEELLEAIREATRGMLEPPITNLGVKGIRTAAKRILKWPELLSEGQVRGACFNLYIFVDAAGGTGGGIFRYMYGRFLAEAAAVTGDERFQEIGKEMRHIGDRWQEVAGIAREASAAPNPADSLPKISSLLMAIADREQAAWTRLREITG